jgi:hypothetical protein
MSSKLTEFSPCFLMLRADTLPPRISAMDHVTLLDKQLYFKLQPMTGLTFYTNWQICSPYRLWVSSPTDLSCCTGPSYFLCSGCPYSYSSKIFVISQWQFCVDLLLQVFKEVLPTWACLLTQPHCPLDNPLSILIEFPPLKLYPLALRKQ